MKDKSSNYLSTALFLILLIFIKFENSQNIEELIEPKCDDKTIKYSIFANLSEYLENEKNIDNRTIFKSINDLKTKRVGYLPDICYFNISSKFDNLIKYDSYEKMVEDLRHYNLDAINLCDGLVNNTQMFSNDIVILPGIVDLNWIGFGFQKDNTTLVNQLNSFIENYIEKSSKESDSERTKWLGINYQIRTINKNLTGENGTLNVVIRLKNEPFSYKDKNGQIMGSEIGFLYGFAYIFGYNLTFIEANTYDEQVEYLKNKSADIAGGFFQIRDDKRNEITFSKPLHPAVLNALVRYENLEDSIEWDFYNSPYELNGDNIGIYKNSSFINLTLNIYNDSKKIYYDGTFELYEALLLEHIDGFFIDEPNAEYFELLYPDRLTYFRERFEENEYAFGVQDNNLLNKFNEFLSKVNKKEIYDKWNAADTSKLTIDKNLNESDQLINVGFLMDLKPLCYKEGNEILGYEIELLYKFAKEYHYNVKLMEINIGERVSYIQDKKANITGGWFTANEERKKLINFTSPIHNAGTVLAVRTDTKKDTVKIKVVDKNNYNKTNNAANIQVFFPNKNITTNSICVFPEKYDDTILINCTISDLNNIDPYSDGFQYLNTSDKMFIACSNLELNNFFQANSKIPGHNDIIRVSNKTCSYTNNTDLNETIPLIKKSSSSDGLSGGAIAGIVIASVVVFLGIIGVILYCLNKKPSKIPFEENRANSAHDLKIPDI